MRNKTFTKILKTVLTTVLAGAMMVTPAMASVWTTTIVKTEGATGEGWVRLTNDSGCSVWRYRMPFGTYMKDGMTPDGYLVNDTGNLYLFNPDAEICEVDSYIYNGLYPFSYDGTVLKNDILGIALSYTEADYYNGDELCIYNGADSAFGQSICYIEIGGDTEISMDLVPHKSDSDISQTIQELRSSRMTSEPLGVAIAGKSFAGYNYIDTSTGNVTWYELFYQLSDTTDLELTIRSSKALGNTDIDKAVSWLNGHLILTAPQISGVNMEYPPETDAVNMSEDTSAFVLEDEIQFIRDTYNYTNEHMAEYTNKGAYVSNSPYMGGEDTYYNVAGDLILMKGSSVSTSNGTMSVECYYLNPAVGRIPDENAYIEELGVFIFGVEGNNEYRIYLHDGFVIRYIGPDGEVHDYPQGLSLMQFSNSFNTDVPIWEMLSASFPGWWIAFETSGD